MGYNREMNKLSKLLAEYGESHQNRVNINIHKVCVPAITFSVVGLLASIPYNIYGVPPVLYVLAAVAIYYASLSIKYLILFLPILFSFLAAAFFLQGQGILWQLSLGIFVLAWIGQFYGHKVEGKKPSFFKDLQFLLIGPLWTIKTILKLKD